MAHRSLQIVSAIMLAGLLACMATPADTQAQSIYTTTATTTAPAPSPALREPALDQLAAPVALYPDALLAQLLMASTYPLDVAEAARWAARHPAPTAAQIAGQRWDSSVKALLPFAPILAMLDKEKSWARQLADAVVRQPDALLRTIQALRERAYDNGALHTARQQQVQRQDRLVTIEAAQRRTVYVPYYDSAKVYGAAGNSLLPPEYWAAQPYAAPQNRPDGVIFSVGVDVPDRAFYDARIDWRTGRLITRRAATANAAGSLSTGPDEWRHDPQYRKRKPAAAASAANGSVVSTESPPDPATSVSTRDAGATPPAPGSHRISTQPRRTNGM